MSDSLVLTGVKDVRKHTGTEMLRLNPKGGGDTFSLKRWWVGAGVSTCYEPCTVFSVTTAAGTVRLALATKAEGSRVRIDHDGSFNFNFSGVGEISRACLFTESFEVIESYVFPNISGGKVMTVTPAGAASRPSGGGGAPGKIIGNVSITGSDTVDDAQSLTYTASTPDATTSDLSYSWSVTGDATIVSGQAAASASISFNYNTGSATIFCQVVSADPDVIDPSVEASPKFITVAAITYDVAVAISSVNGTVGYILSGDVTGENATINLTSGETLSIGNLTGAHPLYLKSVQGAGTGDQVSEGLVVGQGATDGFVTWDTDGVTPGTYFYQCSSHADMYGEIIVS